MKRFLIVIAVAAALGGVAAPAQAYTLSFNTRFYGGGAGLSDNEAVMYAIAGLQASHYWYSGAPAPRVSVGGRTYQVAYLLWRGKLPQCIQVKRWPWSWTTNNNYSTTVKGRGYVGTPCPQMGY
jgi:hypothetical protein